MSADEGAKRLLEFGAYISAGIAAISLSQAALAVTIIAGAVSILLGCIRLYDRIRYGRSG